MFRTWTTSTLGQSFPVPKFAVEDVGPAGSATAGEISTAFGLDDVSEVTPEASPTDTSTGPVFENHWQPAVSSPRIRTTPNTLNSLIKAYFRTNTTRHPSVLQPPAQVHPPLLCPAPSRP